MGQRKAKDLVAHVDKYAVENDLVIIIIPEARFDYNIDAIIKTVSLAHKKRVSSKQEAHQASLKVIQDELNKQLNEIKADFQKKLQDLSKERVESLQSAYESVKAKVDAAEAAHATELATLDDEAIDLIEQII